MTAANKLVNMLVHIEWEKIIENVNHAVLSKCVIKEETLKNNHFF